MPCRVQRAILITLVALLLVPSLALAAGVQALFDLSAPSGGPFPSDHFSVDDASHNTGIRVSLPKPNCATRPSDCADIDVINTLDGFNTEPRLSIPFSGPIDVSTVSSATVFLVSLGDTVSGSGAGKIVGINQIVWDPATNTLHAESDAFLDQHTRYALIVTNGIRDLSGAPVEAGACRRFRHDLRRGPPQHARLTRHRTVLLDARAAAALPPRGPAV